MFSRNIEKIISESIEKYELVVLFGLPKTGKTTLLEKLFHDGVSRVDLKDEDDCFLANSNPKQFLDFYPLPLVVDDAERSPLLVETIIEKILKDKRKKQENDKKLQYFLTIYDSSLLRKIRVSLGEKAKILYLPSLSYLEEKGFPFDKGWQDGSVLVEKSIVNEKLYLDRKEVFERIYRGSLLFDSSKELQELYSDFVDTLVLKCVSELKAIAKEAKFRNLLFALSLRSGTYLQMNELSEMLELDGRTIKRWIDVLVSYRVVAFVDPLLPDVSKRILKTPKFYFLDAGLCAYLARYKNAESISYGPDASRFIETYVFIELYKHFENEGLDPRNVIFTYADIDKRAIPFLIYVEDKIYPVYVGTYFSGRDIEKDMRALKKYSCVIKKPIRFSFTKEPKEEQDLYELPFYSIGI